MIERFTSWWRSFYAREAAPDGKDRLKGTGALLTALEWRTEMSMAQLCQRLQISEDRLVFLVFAAERNGLITSQLERSALSHFIHLANVTIASAKPRLPGAGGDDRGAAGSADFRLLIVADKRPTSNP